MKDKLIIVLAVGLLFLLAGCNTSQNTAMPAVLKTPKPITTQVPLPTSTPRPTATATTTPEIYIISKGYCLTDHQLTGDPTKLKNCLVKEKKQQPLAPGDSIKYSGLLPHKYASFCAIHKLDRTYVTSFIDTQKFGEALCSLQ
jgi:hypothetical protein